MRDLKGYGRAPPDPQWRGGARVAVSFVINFEEGAEMSLSSGEAFNEKAYEVTDEVVGMPDRCMESHFEYAPRPRGGASPIPRAPRHTDDRHHLRIGGGTLALADRGCRQTRPVGWHTRSTPSPNTRRLLVEQGGFLYDSDDYSDDLPFFVEVIGQEHLVLPYSFDTNDMHYHQGFHRFVTARDFAEYTSDAFDTLRAEGERQPKMMAIGLHLRMIGRPGRIAALDPIVNNMRSKGPRLVRHAPADRRALGRQVR